MTKTSQQSNQIIRFLDVKSLAQYISLSEHTIRAWVKQGCIPFSKIGRSVRFDLRKLEGWLEEKEVILRRG